VPLHDYRLHYPAWVCGNTWGEDAMHVIRLYVVGKTERSKKAINDLTTLLKRDFKGQYSLEVINILERPELADEDKIMATPTAVKLLPAPVRKIIGDLRDKEQILLGLDLKGIGLFQNETFSR
jgi:circadian clock protein KaiB